MSKLSYVNYIERCYSYAGEDLQKKNLYILQSELPKVSPELVTRCLDLTMMGFPINTLVHSFRNGYEDKRVAEVVDGVMQKPEVFSNIMNLYTENFNKVLQRGYSLFLCGTNSVGKTYSALRMMRKLFFDSQKRDISRTFYYATFFELYELRNAGYEDPSAKAKFETIVTCDLLIVDEIGKQNKVTDAVVVFYEELVKLRTKRSLPSIYISNIPAYVEEPKGTSFVKPSGKNIPTVRGLYGDSCYAAMTEHFRFFLFSSNNPDLRTQNRWSL